MYTWTTKESACFAAPVLSQQGYPGFFGLSWEMENTFVDQQS